MVGVREPRPGRASEREQAVLEDIRVAGPPPTAGDGTKICRLTPRARAYKALLE